MPPSRPTTVFRVRGLPAGDLDKAEHSLMTTIDEHLSDRDRQTIEPQVTVVPSCDDEETLDALVHFSGGIPDFLSELTANPLGDSQVEMNDADDISFDRHFHGFTQLYNTKAESAITAEWVSRRSLV
jgi:protein SERAC1